jgi:hypothetical protein
MESAMGVFRAGAVAAAFVLLFTAVDASACNSSGRLVASHTATPNLVAGPIAWNGNRVLLTKKSSSDSSLWVSTYDAALNSLSADTKIAAKVVGDPIAVLFNGEEFAVFYRSLTSLILQRVSAEGAAIGGPTVVPLGRTIGGTAVVDVTWSPALDAYVVGQAISSGTQIGSYVTVVDASGNVIRDTPLFITPRTDNSMRVAVNESGIIGAFLFSVSGNLVFVRVEGSLVSPYDIANEGKYVTVTTRDGDFAVARQVETLSGSEIDWLIIDSSGQTVLDEDLLVEGEGEVRPVSFLNGAGELALTYLDAPEGFNAPSVRYRMRRMTLDGDTITDSLFLPGNLVSSRATSLFPAVWTGDSYISSALYTPSNSSKPDSYLLRYCPLTLNLPSSMYVRFGNTMTLTADAEGAGGSYTYRWMMGDGPFPFTGQTVTHRYLHPGDFVATVTVTDISGATVTKSILIHVVNPKRRSARN